MQYLLNSVRMEKRPRAILCAGIALFGIGLGLFAYLGIYNRYWGDDWCFNADFRELGYLGTIKGYTYITTYSSSRYSMTIISGLLFYLGILGVQIMTPLSIALLIFGLWRSITSFHKVLGEPFSAASPILIAAIAVYYTIYLAPHLYQSLYWQSATLPYFEPLAFGALIFALILRRSLSVRRSRWIDYLIALPACLAAGFSEAGCATLITALSIYIFAAWAQRGQAWAKRSLPAAASALGGALIGLVLLVASPTAGHRLGLYGEPASLIRLPYLILSFSYDFVKFSLQGLPLPHLAIAGISMSLGFILHTPNGQPRRAKTMLLAGGLIVGAAFLLIAASFAPSAYIEQSPPHPRTRIIPRFVLTLTLVILFWGLGSVLRQKYSGRPYLGAALVLFFAVFLYTTRSLVMVLGSVPVYAERAALWDKRDLQIRSLSQAGAAQIETFAIDGLPVGGIRDFDSQGEPGYWINKCAARYYGVEKIDVVSP